jgi:hypothetical protein
MAAKKGPGDSRSSGSGAGRKISFKHGEVVRPFNYKGNVEVKGEFRVSYDASEAPGIGVAALVTGAVNGFLNKRIETLTAAVNDLNAKLEKHLKESGNLLDSGKGKEALAKVDQAKKLFAEVQPVLKTFLAGTPPAGEKFVQSWWAEAQAKDKKLLGLDVSAAAKATATITAGAIGAAASLATAAVSAGETTADCFLKASEAATAASTSHTALKAAYESFDSAYHKLSAAYLKTQSDLQRLAIIKAQQPPDRYRMDKIKSFLSGGTFKNLESALAVYQVKVREGETRLAKYGTEVDKLLSKLKELLKAAQHSKNRDQEAKAQKIWERVENICKKLEGLRKRMDDAKKIAADAAKLIQQAKAGKLEVLGGNYALGKLSDMKSYLQDGAIAHVGLSMHLKIADK